MDFTIPDTPLVTARWETRFAQDIWTPRGAAVPADSPSPGAEDSGTTVSEESAGFAGSSLLYVAEGVQGLAVLDLSDPTRPREVSSCPDTYAAAIAVWKRTPPTQAGARTGGPAGGRTTGSRFAFVVDGKRIRQIAVLVPEWAYGP